MIHWITPQLGTSAATELHAEQGIVALDVRDLVDKEGNAPAQMRLKLERGAALLGSGQRIVVLCDYGISRSNAVAAGILALVRGVSLNQTVRDVMRATGEPEIKLELLDAVRVALGEEVERSRSELRLLLLGAQGFIGRRILKHLGRTVAAAPSRSELNLLTDSVALDLLAREQGVTGIVHLANPKVYASNAAMGETLVMLRNVLDVCRANRLDLLFPSSWEIFSGYRSTHLLANESLAGFPKGPYGETKFLCEALIGNHAQRYGLECCVVRSGPVYGKGSPRPKFIYTFLEKARARERITTHRYRNGEPALGLLHIDDYVRGLAAIIEKRFIGTIHLGSAESVTTRAVAETIVRLAVSDSEMGVIDIDDYYANVTMDSSLARRKLDWEPKVSLTNGLLDALALGEASGPHADPGA